MAKSLEHTDYQAYRLLQFAFVIVPIVAGIDKFFNYLVNWSMYLSPVALQTLQGHDQTFMMAVGVVEIIVGIGVMLKPKVFAYIVAVWLLGIVTNLLLAEQFLDIALRDLGLAFGALALGRLSHKFDR